MPNKGYLHERATNHRNPEKRSASQKRQRADGLDTQCHAVMARVGASGEMTVINTYTVHRRNTESQSGANDFVSLLFHASAVWSSCPWPPARIA